MFSSCPRCFPLSQFTYDDAGKVTNFAHKDGAGANTIDSFTYNYNVANWITQVTSYLDPVKNYNYDANGQVKTDGATTYTWDNNGNRADTGYTVTAGNRQSSDGTWTYTYDNEGNEVQQYNPTTQETRVYSYDNDNRLTHMEKRTSQNGASIESVDFKYDALGNRIERDYDADGAGSGSATVLKMAYDLNGNAWADLNSSLTIQTRRIYTEAVDALFARIGASGNEDWYLTDNIGSVRDIVDSTGSAIDHLNYTTFGGIASESQPTNGDRYKFTSREWEAEFGIQYSRARYLQNGRWMSEDPEGLDAGDPNLQRYVANSPTDGTDPDGLFRRSGDLNNPGPELQDIDRRFPEEWLPPEPPPRVGVGQPGFLEGCAPGWGPGRAALDHAQNGEWASAIGNGIFAALDLTGAVWLARQGVRLGARALSQAAVRAAAAQAARAAERRAAAIAARRAAAALAAARASRRSLLDRIVAEANRVASQGGRITEAQATILRQNLPRVQRRGAAATRQLRREFRSRQGELIAEWEAQTGRQWPAGATPHHIIPIESGGANAWWNLMPTNGRLPNHSLPGIPGPHARGGALRQTVQRSRTRLRPGTTTDLTRPQ